MSKSSAKKPQRNLRELILATTLRLFSNRGYFNTSIHDISREAGVSVGAIYHHFQNKEGLAEALYEEILNHFLEVNEQIMREHENCHDRCRAIVHYIVENARKEPEMMQFVLYAKHKEFMPDAKPLCSSRPFEMLREMVEEGISKGEIRQQNPWVAAAALFGGALHMAKLYWDGVLDAPLDTYLEEIWSSAWRAVCV